MTKTQEAGGENAPFSVCLFCGSSKGAVEDYAQAAADFGRILAGRDVRLVYGGGGVGLMGAAAKAAHTAGGKVLGVMPDFLRQHEGAYHEVETTVVTSMHDRKRIMFENSDAFAIFPGGIGTLEEVVELMSWRRLDLHRKPIVFLNLHGFWGPFLDMMAHTVEQKFTPTWMAETWGVVDTVEEVLPMMRKMQSEAGAGPGFHGYIDQNVQVGSKL